MRRHFFTALLLLAPFAGVAAAQDSTQTQRQDSVMPTQSNDEQMAPLSDEAVLMRIHHTNLLEIRAGKLAQRNGGTAKVKAFGARLVRDHSAADQKVMALAKKLNISVTRGPWADTTAGKYGRDRQHWNQRPDSTMPMDSTQRTDTASHQGYGQRNDSTQGRDPMGRGEGQEHAQVMERLGTLHGAAFDAEFANAMVQGHEKAIAMLERVQPQLQHDELRTFITNTLPTLRQHLQIAQSLGGTSATASGSQQ